MEKEKNEVLEALYKSIQTFDGLAIEAECRDKLYRYNDAFMQSVYSILNDTEHDEAEKMAYFEVTVNQYADALMDLLPKLIKSSAYRTPDTLKAVGKSDQSQIVEIVEVEKFNPYHDSRGRFSSANGYASFTTRTRDPSKQHMADAAVAREKERSATSAEAEEPKEAPKQEQPQEQPKNTISATSTKSELPDSVLNKCQEVEAKTVSRKTEKMTLVDADGNVILEKSGGKGSVSFGAKEGFHMNESTTLTHNHPGEYGGTFSGADVKVMVDYRLRAIRAVCKEGTYSLERTSKTNSNDSYDFNRAYQKQSDSLNYKMRTEYNSQKKKIARGETSVNDANQQLADYRTGLCNQQHEWLVQNAPKYGYNYVFTPSEGGVSKMADDITKATEEPEETTGDVMLDGEFINGDGWMIKEGSADSDEE